MMKTIPQITNRTTKRGARKLRGAAMPNDDNLHREASSSSEIGVSPAAEITREGSVRVTEIAEDREEAERRHQALQHMLLRKRQEIMQEIQDNVGQSLMEDQQRRLDSLSDAGDQALMDREL